MIYLKLLCLFAISFQLFASEPEFFKELGRKGYKFIRIDNKDDTLETVAESIYQKNSFRYPDKSYALKDLKKWNPHLQGLSSIEGEYLYVENPHAFAINYNWAPSLAGRKKILDTDPDDVIRVREGNYRPGKLVGFAHVTVSQGNFSENFSGASINSQQNSPLTLGAGLGYKPKSFFDLSFSSSVYISKLNGTVVKEASGTIPTEKTAPSEEIGLTAYVQKNFETVFFKSVYGGVDIERLSTFNLSEISNGSSASLAFNEHLLTFATIGVGFSFKLLLPSAVKVSYSKSVQSSTLLEGNKYLIYFNQKISKRFWYHILYKHHELSNNSNLTIDRFGVGVGMVIF